MIDTKALRQKILDLAIQGKLTEQLPEDGTAEELFQQIQIERKNQEDKGLIKHEELLNLEENSIPFSISDNWQWTYLGNVSYIVRGGSPRPIKQYITNGNDGINWIKIGDVEKGGKYIFHAKEKIIAEGEKKSRRVYPGDFLLTNSMSFGRPYISNIEGCIHDGWLLIRNLQGFDSDYLYYLLSSSFLYNQFSDKASGSTVDNLNIEKVKTAIIPLPPLLEQVRIAKKVSELFSIIEIIENACNRYKENLYILKSKLIDAAIQGKLTEQLPEDGTAEELYQQIQQEKRKLEAEGKIKKEKALPPVSEDEIPFDIPQNWKWCRLIDVGTTNIGLTYHPQDICSDGITVIRSSNIQNGKMDYSDIVKVKCDIRENQYLMKNDIVICARNGSKALVGKCAIYEGESYTESFGAFMAIFRTPIFRYLYFYFNTMAFRRYFSGDDSKQINQVTQNTLKESVFPLPPLAEQKRIVAKLEELLPLCE